MMVDRLCQRLSTREEQQKCYELASSLRDLLEDLDSKGYLRSELGLEIGWQPYAAERRKLMNLMSNANKTTMSYNAILFKSRSLKTSDLTENELKYLFNSTLVFSFLQSIELFRVAFLFVLKLPIPYTVEGRTGIIDNRTTLGKLFRSLEALEVRGVDDLGDIDYHLRNGLSHCLFWFDEEGESQNPEPHLHYSEDASFQRISSIRIADLMNKTQKQSLRTNLLLNVIADLYSY